MKAISIPFVVWKDKRLTATQKAIYGAVCYLANGYSHECDSSNEDIAKFCDCTERTISSAITELAKCKYLDRVSFDGRIRVLRIRNIQPE